MPKDLAKRVQEIIVRQSACSNFKKRAIDLGCVSGAAEALIINAQPGAALNDLLLLRGPGLQLAAADVARALTAAVQFAQRFAPVLHVVPQAAADFGAVAFAIAYEVIYDHMVLSKENVIAASKLATTSSCPATSTATDCDVGCKMIGPIQFCSTICTRTTTGCSPTGSIRTTAFEGKITGPRQTSTGKITTARVTSPYCIPL